MCSDCWQCAVCVCVCVSAPHSLTHLLTCFTWTHNTQEFAQADGFILVYDVTNKFSLERVRMYHQKIVQMHSPEEKFPLVIVGNKSDRSGEGEREVSTREGLQLGDEFGCPCFETSTTMNNKGVSEVFQEILRLIEKSNREKSFRIGGSGSPRGSPRGKRTGSGIGLLSGGRRGFLSFLESNREVDEEQEFEAYRRQRKEMEERAER